MRATGTVRGMSDRRERIGWGGPWLSAVPGGAVAVLGEAVAVLFLVD